MKNATVSIPRRLARLLIKTGRLRGPVGWPGRFYGRRFGAPLDNGLRLIIRDPMEYMQRYVIARGTYEPRIAQAFAAGIRPGDVVFDVGGNIGNHTLNAVGAGAVVHVFEPLPRLAERLRENVRLNRIESRVTIVGAAVGAAAGEATLNVAHRADDGSHSLISGVSAQAMDTVRVPVVALDDYVRGHPDARPALVKIDVEGYEAKVLDGGRSLFSTAPHPIVVIETGDRLADDIGESAASVTGRLFSAGYRLFNVPEVEGEFVEESPTTLKGDLANYLAIHRHDPRFPVVRESLALRCREH